MCVCIYIYIYIIPIVDWDDELTLTYVNYEVPNELIFRWITIYVEKLNIILWEDLNHGWVH